MSINIKGLHHNAYRCRDSEETREFYEDFLGLPLAEAFQIKTTQTGRDTSVLHSFYEMDDGSLLAFFESTFLVFFSDSFEASPREKIVPSLPSSTPRPTHTPLALECIFYTGK